LYNNYWKIGWHSVSLNFKKELNDSIGISFTHFEKPLSDTETTSSTVLVAIKDNHTLEVNLNSGKLIY
jgi:hypothetical protein